MKAGEKYRPYEPLGTASGSELSTAKVYVASSVDQVVDPETGEVSTLMKHHANRPEWYMQRQQFNPKPRPEDVTLRELVFETVRAYPGLDRVEIFALANMARPRKKFTIDSMSHALSEDPRIQMFDRGGTPVDRIEHNERYCTFSIAANKKQ